MKRVNEIARFLASLTPRQWHHQREKSNQFQQIQATFGAKNDSKLEFDGVF